MKLRSIVFYYLLGTVLLFNAAWLYQLHSYVCSGIAGASAVVLLGSVLREVL
jgi:hypothetical protein